MRLSRAREAVARTLSKPEIEERLDELLRHSGEPALQRLRDDARDPTVYRNNYLMALKALSQNVVTGALVRVIDFAQKYTAAVDFSDLDRARLVLDRTHAFADPNEADAAGIRLVLPMPEVVSDVQH